MRHMWVVTLLLGLVALPVHAAGPISDPGPNSGANSDFSLLDGGGFVSAEVTTLSQSWPDDFHRYADQFCQLRDLCAQAAQNYWNNKGKNLSSPQLHPVSTRGAEEYRASMRKKLPAYMNKRLAELDGAVAMEYQLNHCPLLSSASVGQKIAFNAFKAGVAILNNDVGEYHYSSCRDMIDFWIGDRCTQLRQAKAIEAKKAKNAKVSKNARNKGKKLKRAIAQQEVQQ